MGDFDVHYEYVCFIILIALYHRLLDKPTGTSIEVAKFRVNMAKIMNDLREQKTLGIMVGGEIPEQKIANLIKRAPARAEYFKNMAEDAAKNAEKATDEAETAVDRQNAMINVKTQQDKAKNFLNEITKLNDEYMAVVNQITYATDVNKIEMNVQKVTESVKRAEAAAQRAEAAVQRAEATVAGVVEKAREAAEKAREAADVADRIANTMELSIASEKIRLIANAVTRAKEAADTVENILNDANNEGMQQNIIDEIQKAVTTSLCTLVLIWQSLWIGRLLLD